MYPRDSLQGLTRRYIDSYIEESNRYTTRGVGSYYSDLARPASSAHPFELHCVIPNQLVGFRSKKFALNQGSLLLKLPASSLCNIAKHLFPRYRLLFSNTCRAVREVLVKDISLWDHLLIYRAPPILVPAFFNRIPGSPLHLQVITFDRQSANTAELAAFLSSNLTRLASLKLQFYTNYRAVGPENIAEFLANGGGHELVPIPRALFSWTESSPTDERMAERLHTLEIDCGAHWSISDAEPPWQLSWRLPADRLGPALRRCLLRGVAFPINALATLRGLVEFAYAGPATLTPGDIDHLLLSLPNLTALSLRCKFKAVAPLPSWNRDAYTPGPAKVVISWFPELENQVTMLEYIMSRGMSDIVIYGSVLVPLTLIKSRKWDITVVCAELSGISYRFTAPDGRAMRIRMPATPRSDELEHILSIWSESVTELTVHEGFWEEMVSRSARLPQLVTLRVRFAVRIDRVIMPWPFSSFFLIENAKNISAPRLANIEFWGDLAQRACNGQRHAQEIGPCWCCSAGTISLRDVQQAIAGYTLPSLARVRICGLECVGVEVAHELEELCRLVPCVEIEPNERFQRELSRISATSDYSAQYVFECLQKGEYMARGTEWDDSFLG
ncbi:hypothetical protein BKA62DRAFT_704079 [Auriculariales sp. MPI-PUGE-AT-0066]|nr:hypothetical protein BKA62DRAFT_704079 [Auriculariales sp. MPI-PUGE-AT-0066]